MAETVTVACKIPAGLCLRVFKMEEFDEPLMGGGYRRVQRAQELGPRIRLNGSAYRQDRAPAQTIVGGFGLTSGVPKEFWDAWLEQNKDADFIRNGLVFAHARANAAEGEAKEKAGLPSGLERLDPAKPPPGIVPVSAARAA